MGNGLTSEAPITQSERRAEPDNIKSAFDSPFPKRAEFLPEDGFNRMLILERRRTERSRKLFALMTLDAGAIAEGRSADVVMSRIIFAILKCTRESDLIGWYQKGVVLGAIFTEIGPELADSIAGILQTKVANALSGDAVTGSVMSSLKITVHLFPSSGGKDGNGPVVDARLYPDIAKERPSTQLARVIKRIMDIAGSALLLVLASPLLAIIGIAIKLTSKGPVIFRQVRLGQFGSRFHCLKFRTMYVHSDSRVHEEYIRGFIGGQPAHEKEEAERPPVYKITSDSRVTAIGRLLRRTSLDELPQFWNVLRGEMSLVGPRPPVPYEFEMYDVWHRRRVLEVKPGVTGLWQVSGRSRVSFDDMVRLDLRYAQSWSLWLDLKILLATPRAVLTGEGAY